MQTPARKYIREYQWGLVVDIRRAGRQFQRGFAFRRHISVEATWEAARRWRDQTHEQAFGVPVTAGFAHVSTRRPLRLSRYRYRYAPQARWPQVLRDPLASHLQGLRRREIEHRPGISVGRIKRRRANGSTYYEPTYFVVSYYRRDTQGRPRIARKRYNFRKLGETRALEDALAFARTHRLTP